MKKRLQWYNEIVFTFFPARRFKTKGNITFCKKTYIGNLLVNLFNIQPSTSILINASIIPNYVVTYMKLRVNIF